MIFSGTAIESKVTRECAAAKAGTALLIKRCVNSKFLGYFGFGLRSQQLYERYLFAGHRDLMTAPRRSLVKLPAQWVLVRRQDLATLRALIQK